MASLSLQLAHVQRENRELRASLSLVDEGPQVAAPSPPTAARSSESRWRFLRLRRRERRLPFSGDAKRDHVQQRASRSARSDGSSQSDPSLAI